ncbi:MAG: acylphosphatase [Candidatus Peregrinibacteria bacterium]|nr:acylphosphatase [Candidatus Peregrinibacteria bacterium]
MPALTLRITGKVQGVFYRARTQEQALTLGLCGWVKNLPDGSVEIHAEGEEAALQELDQWCRKGPPSAEVKSVIASRAVEEDFPTFEIIQEPGGA